MSPVCIASLSSLQYTRSFEYAVPIFWILASSSEYDLPKLLLSPRHLAVRDAQSPVPQSTLLCAQAVGYDPFAKTLDHAVPKLLIFLP